MTSSTTMVASGTPQPLLWMVAEGDLTGFKDKKMQNESRRHVMKDFLHKEGVEKRNQTSGPASLSDSRSTVSPVTTTASSTERHSQLSKSNRQTYQQLASPAPSDGSLVSPVYGPVRPANLRAPKRKLQTEDEKYRQLHRYFAALRAMYSIPGFFIQHRSLVDRPYIDRGLNYPWESTTFRMTTSLPRIHVGKPTDPFNAMPQGWTPDYDIQYIKYHCINFFATGKTRTWWAPLANVTLHSFFSNLCLCAIHFDIMRDFREEQRVTTALRLDSIIRINRCISERQLDDSVIQSVVHIILVDLIAGTLLPLEAHEAGVKKMLEERGGLMELGMHGMLANTLAIVSMESAILRESKADPIYRNYVNSMEPSIPPEDQSIPESPLYAPHESFYTLARCGDKCQGYTYELISDMRRITDLFLDLPHFGKGHATEEIKEIHDRVLRLPSSEEDHAKYGGDQVYEACRLASCIYVIAIQHRIPLSEAANLVSRPPSLQKTPPANGLHALEALRNAIKSTNNGQCWLDFNMTGVMYWITLIAGAACSFLAVRNIPLEDDSTNELRDRTRNSRYSTRHTSSTSSRWTKKTRQRQIGRPTPTTGSRLGSQAVSTSTAETPSPASSSRASRVDSEYSQETKFLRKWYAALNMQSMALLAFQHPVPVVLATDRMARVVEKLIGGSNKIMS